MQFEELKLKGVFLITPKVFGDSRGFFMETYNRAEFVKNGIKVKFIQDNHSRSEKNVLRGLHFQKEPFAQAKLVRVTRGEVLDVAVDLRQASPTFKQYVAVKLSEENKQVFFIPKGFAHGFLALSDVVDFQYKTTAPYSPESERAIIWNDPEIGVDWAVKKPNLSDRDKKHPFLKEIDKADLF